MSALTKKADIQGDELDVCLVLIADVMRRPVGVTSSGPTDHGLRREKDRAYAPLRMPIMGSYDSSITTVSWPGRNSNFFSALRCRALPYQRQNPQLHDLSVVWPRYRRILVK